MKVFVIIKREDYVGDSIVKVVSTRDKAIEFCDSGNDISIFITYDYEEMDVE